MVKKSKSVIMTAKDIPMNAFMAMRGAAAEKDEKWLQGFLSESVVEDIPWECSKALIIMKDGFQVGMSGLSLLANFEESPLLRVIVDYCKI